MADIEAIKLVDVTGAISAGDGAVIVAVRDDGRPIKLVMTQQAVEQIKRAIDETVWVMK